MLEGCSKGGLEMDILNFSLKDKGVGALYLGSAVTPFELKANDGKLQGVMRESSVYLKENGKIGTLQELDLVV